MEQKYMNIDKAKQKEPEFTTLISKVCGDTNIQSKQAQVLQYKCNIKV